MYDEHEGPDPGEVAGPGEGHEADGGDVVDEHLPVCVVKLPGNVERSPRGHLYC